GYLKSGSPPGASITPSSETNSVTTIRAAICASPCCLVVAGRVVRRGPSVTCRRLRPGRAREVIARARRRATGYEAAMPKPPLPPRLQEVLAKPNPAVIGSVSPDGSPNTVATWYVWDNGRVLISMDEGRRRLEYLRREPRVSLTV